jgi:hypothetical protein
MVYFFQSRLKQQEERCQHLQSALKQQQRHSRKILEGQFFYFLQLTFDHYRPGVNPTKICLQFLMLSLSVCNIRKNAFTIKWPSLIEKTEKIEASEMRLF